MPAAPSPIRSSLSRRVSPTLPVANPGFVSKGPIRHRNAKHTIAFLLRHEVSMPAPISSARLPAHSSRSASPSLPPPHPSVPVTSPHQPKSSLRRPSPRLPAPGPALPPPPSVTAWLQPSPPGHRIQDITAALPAVSQPTNVKTAHHPTVPQSAKMPAAIALPTPPTPPLLTAISIIPEELAMSSASSTFTGFSAIAAGASDTTSSSAAGAGLFSHQWPSPMAPRRTAPTSTDASDPAWSDSYLPLASLSFSSPVRPAFSSMGSPTSAAAPLNPLAAASSPRTSDMVQSSFEIPGLTDSSGTGSGATFSSLEVDKGLADIESFLAQDIDILSSVKSKRQ